VKRILHNIISAAVVSVCCLALFACSGGGQTDLAKSSQVLAKVGDKEITTSYFDRQVANLPETAKQLVMQGQGGKKAMLEGLVNRELIFNEAVKNKLDKDAEINRKAEDMKKELIINTYLQNEIGGKIKVSEGDVRAYYDQNPGEFKNREEMHLAQIVVADDKKAAEVMGQLANGKNFGDLAQDASIDKMTAQRKGDVGWFTYKRLPQEVRDGVYKLKPGDISQPYKMGANYEIYKMLERKTSSYSFEQVKGAVQAQLQAEKYQAALKAKIDELKKGTTVTINESLLK